MNIDWSHDVDQVFGTHRAWRGRRAIEIQEQAVR